MTIAELVEILKNIDPDSEVLFESSDGIFVPITSVVNTHKWYGDHETNDTIISWLD